MNKYRELVALWADIELLNCEIRRLKEPRPIEEALKYPEERFLVFDPKMFNGKGSWHVASYYPASGKWLTEFLFLIEPTCFLPLPEKPKEIEESYESRRAEAERNYKNALKRVAETPAPLNQKFPIGSFVQIAKDLGEHMTHFTNDTAAQVQHTYQHAFGHGSVTSYSLLVRMPGKGWYSSAWYYEHQLTLIEDPELIEKYKKEIDEKCEK